MWTKGRGFLCMLSKSERLILTKELHYLEDQLSRCNDSNIRQVIKDQILLISTSLDQRLINIKYTKN
jgi:hypothetical protein